MGQIQNVLVFRLLCDDTVDEAIIRILEKKQYEFDLYADESTIAEAADNLVDKEWVQSVIEAERQKYLPVVYKEYTEGESQ